MIIKFVSGLCGKTKMPINENLKVSKLVDFMIDYVGYAKNGTYEIAFKDGDILDLDKTFVENGVTEKSTLLFLDMGDAV